MRHSLPRLALSLPVIMLLHVLLLAPVPVVRALPLGQERPHAFKPWILGAGDASYLQVTGFPSPVTAGATENFDVTVKDSGGDTVTDYVGTVHFTSSDPLADLPADYAFVPGDAGTHSFSAALATAGSGHTITATDVKDGSITGTQTGIEITAAGASTLQVEGYPTPATAGEGHTITVTVKDAYGNTVTGYLGTVTFTSNDPQAVLPGGYTFVPEDAGTKDFGVTLKTVGSGRSVTVTDTVNGSITGTQTGIEITAAMYSVHLPLILR